jgi:hypothetical protein
LIVREIRLQPGNAIELSLTLSSGCFSTRYYKTARNFLAAIHLASAVIWLN